MTSRKTSKTIFKKISMSLIDRPDDIVRLEINQDDLRELADSIRDRGLMQPIGVTPRKDRFMIVFGDRRYLAHELLGEKEIMCYVKESDETQVVIDRAVENIQRVNLTPFEEGHIYHGLLEKAGLSLDAISGMVKKSAGVVQRRIDILRMPESFQKALHAGSISVTIAEELWKCPDKAKREYFLELAVDHGISMRVAREWVDEFKKDLRQKEKVDGGGRGTVAPFEDTPIYRACDLCTGPVEYKDLKELRICGGCHKSIFDALKRE